MSCTPPLPAQEAGNYIVGMAFFQTKHLRIINLSDGIAVLVLDRDQNAINMLDPALLGDLDRALDAMIDANEHRLLVILSGKRGNFCQGPTPAILSSWNKDAFHAWAERGQRLCAKLVEMPIPSLCVIAGSCFDAGLELALACDHRVAVADSLATFGFPGLEWGMIPCWGATQRLPRLIGLDPSLQMLLTGKRLDGRMAWQWDLVDDLADEAGADAPWFLLDSVKRDWTRFPDRTWRQRWLEANRPGRWLILRGAERIVRTRIPAEIPASALMLDALRIAYRQPSLQPGLDFERQAVDVVAAHPALHHLLRLVQHREKLRTPSIAPARSGARTIGILGGGLAGLSLLLHSVTQGYDVVLRTENEQTLGAALAQIVQLLQVEVKNGEMSPGQFQRILGSIRGTYTWTHFANLDILVDTTDGLLADKQAFYREVERHVPAAALIVPTTPSHKIADLGHGMNSPQRLVGMRPIEPWNRGSVVELVTESGSGAANVQRVREWAVAIGKCVLPTPDRIGGVVMRVWLPALNEAGLLIKEGVSIERIDKAMTRFGMTFGPCEWMDRLGLDHIASLITALQVIFAGRITFETGFMLMVEKGWLGNKSAAGFYRPGYLGRRPQRELTALWQTSQGEAGIPVPTLAKADAEVWIHRRLVTLMMLEAVHCLVEGLVKDPNDLDCAMCLTGWATHRGGPIGHARTIGIESLTACCKELVQQHGPRFAPPAALAAFV